MLSSRRAISSWWRQIEFEAMVSAAVYVRPRWRGGCNIPFSTSGVHKCSCCCPHHAS